jgi:hypothetical protein
MPTIATAPTHLLLEYLFNLSHFLLDFADELFVLAFGSQVGVVDDPSRLLFNGTLRLMQTAFNFVLRALFHVVSPYRFDVNADSGERLRKKSRTGKGKRDSPDGRSASVESKPGKRQKPGPLSTSVARVKAFSGCACSQLLTIAGNHPESEPAA